MDTFIVSCHRGRDHRGNYLHVQRRLEQCGRIRVVRCRSVVAGKISFFRQMTQAARIPAICDKLDINEYSQTEIRRLDRLDISDSPVLQLSPAVKGSQFDPR